MTQPSRNSDPERPPTSFVVPMYAAIFKGLSYVSLFELLRRKIPWLRDPARGYAVVEAWVLLNTAISLLAAITVHYINIGIGLSLMLIYGLFRVFEILVVQMNVLFFDEWRARKRGVPYALRGYKRIALLLLHNYAEIIFWFMAALFALHTSNQLTLEDPSFIATFRTSLLSMVSFSSDGVKALNWLASIVLVVQSVVGIFMTILTLSRFISMIPSPDTQDETERK